MRQIDKTAFEGIERDERKGDRELICSMEWIS
jgi:hypothetical protein